MGMRFVAVAVVNLLLFCEIGAGDEVKAQLLLDHAVVAQGKPFAAGVLLEIPAGWHVYWKYPGDAGLATAVKWELPPGFRVSELSWPIPRRFPGEVEIIGYENQVMLTAVVTPPERFVGDASIGASISWLACKDLCVPGKAATAARLRVGGGDEPANQELFSTWRARMPLEMSSPADGKLVRVERVGFEYSIHAPALENSAAYDLFIAPPSWLKVHGISQERQAEGWLIRLSMTELEGVAQDAARLEALLVWRVDAASQPRAIRVLLPTQ